MTKKFRLNLLFSSPLALLLISVLLSLIGQKKKRKTFPHFTGKMFIRNVKFLYRLHETKLHPNTCT